MTKTKAYQVWFKQNRKIRFKTPSQKQGHLERETGFEPATFSLEG